MNHASKGRYIQPVFRSGRPEDAVNITRLQRRAVEDRWEIFVADFDSFLEERFDPQSQAKKYSNRISNGEQDVIVAEIEDSIVGFCSTRCQAADEQPCAYSHQITALYVDPRFQRLGIGLSLIKKALEKLKSEKVERISAWCFRDNNAARHLYEKSGGRLLNAIAPEEYDRAAPHVAYGWNLRS